MQETYFYLEYARNIFISWICKKHISILNMLEIRQVKHIYILDMQETYFYLEYARNREKQLQELGKKSDR